MQHIIGNTAVYFGGFFCYGNDTNWQWQIVSISAVYERVHLPAQCIQKPRERGGGTFIANVKPPSNGKMKSNLKFGNFFFVGAKTNNAMVSECVSDELFSWLQPVQNEKNAPFVENKISFYVGLEKRVMRSTRTYTIRYCILYLRQYERISWKYKFQ